MIKHTSSGSDLDVEGVNADFLASSSNILSCQHGGVWGRLVTVSLDLHSTSDTADGFTTAVRYSSQSSCLEFSWARWQPNYAASSGPGARTYLRSVTWTKVSLKEAKIRATPKTFSPRRERGMSVSCAGLHFSSGIFSSLLLSYPHGLGGREKRSQRQGALSSSWEACCLMLLIDG